MLAKLASFYGWRHEEILQLDYEVAQGYWLAITAIEAQEILINMRLADWPNMKGPARQKWHRDVHRMAYPSSHSKAITPEELAKRIGGIGRVKPNHQ